MREIITLTMNPAVDKSATVEQVTSNVKLRAHGVRRDPGGGGINVSRAIARLGGSSRAAYVSGGPEGELLAGLLAHEALDPVPLPVDDSIRENLTVTESSSGEQYRFGMPGPHLTDEELDRITAWIESNLPSGSILVASGSLPPGAPVDLYARVARSAREQDALVVVDASGEALTSALEAGLFLIKPNLHELAQILGEEELEGPRIREAASEIVREGKAEHVIVSLGSGGAVIASGDGTTQVAAPTVPVQSRIGAGDSMIGGIVWSLAGGDTPETALRWGVAAGAAAVMTPGTELCRGEDVRRLFEEVG